MWSSDETSDQLAIKLLDTLEERELELLTWGFLDGGFTSHEIDGLANAIVSQHDDYVDSDHLIDLLLDRRLLFDFPVGERRLYRTRFAESVRLFAQLRQIFDEKKWDISPRLVADYRLSVRPRRYPRRYIEPSQVIKRLEAKRKCTTIEKAVLHALLSPPGQNDLLLSDFQVLATGQLLDTLRSRNTNGVIICAGTGTGKTLAFYLPCLMKVANFLEKDEHWTQMIAIYPRNELLKDQFTEAYKQTRLIDAATQQRTNRKICLGAYFGPTPRKAQVDAVENAEWDKRSGGFVCPFLRCPKCENDLVWKRRDIERGRNRLVCVDTQCGGEVRDDEIFLTRDTIQSTPPDILFTTTEMLNRQMSSSWSGHVFGIGQSRERSPYMMLLDEVHTYYGTHGAQVGLLIRRWRHMIRCPVQFVGLSATLNDAQGFFADLVGLPPGSVEVIDAGNDLEEEGKEYQLVLRGDPISATSLVSTSIQTAMLLGRILDPPGNSRSGNIFASKLFLFTDDLDVTNRIFHNLQDAEGLDSYGRPRTDKQPLASFRSSNRPDTVARFREGQSWRICEEIGHNLDPPNNQLQIDRTTSQDPGVKNTSQVVVATSSLEVGYNDLTVGAILQHKAPRNTASFLQRRGRAGRIRITRPWTIVVLSDYGRDRLAYQAYEQLFDPVLERPSLPIRNRYVLRIQMVYAFMDWVATQIKNTWRGSVWDDFAGPARNDYVKQRQEHESGIIHKLLTDSSYREQLAQYLQRALRVSEDEVLALFWEPPRAMITAVLPTLLRRLNTTWKRISLSSTGQSDDYQVPHVPLPDFVPENLFSDLSVPEVAIRTPRHGTDKKDTWSLPLTQALKTIAPGRVTRRFGIKHILDSHWIEPPDLVSSRSDMPLRQLFTEYEDIGTFQATTADSKESHSTIDLRCVRPWVIDLTQSPSNVLPTSNAFLDWRSQLYNEHPGEVYDILPNSPLEKLVKSITFFTHNLRCPLHVRRFALGSNASVRFRNGDEHTIYIRFTDDTTGNPVAIGFEHEVDGILFECDISDEFRRNILSGDGLHACRNAYFLHLVTNDTILLKFGNSFRLGWLGQIYLSLVLEKAMRQAITLAEATKECRLQINMEEIDQVLNAIFHVVDVEVEKAEDESKEDIDKGGRVHDAIRTLLNIDDVRKRLGELSDCLWKNPDAAFHEWLNRRLKATLGGAFLQACYQLSPQYQVGDLHLDIEGGPLPPVIEQLLSRKDAIWITESTIGGVGVIEEVLRRYSEDPRRFFLLVEAVFGLSDFEVIDEELTHILELTQSTQEVAQSFAYVREANTNEALKNASQDLMKSLAKHNVLLTHSVMTSLNARILRTGTSEQTDALLYTLIHRWQDEENRLEVDIDARVFAYLANSDREYSEQLSQVLQNIGGSVDGAHLNRYAVLYSLLWPRGSMIRERALESYNPYVNLPSGDSKLIRDQLFQQIEIVSLEDTSWREQVDSLLAKQGIAHIATPSEQRNLLHNAIMELVSQPVEAGFLRLYPYVARVQRMTGNIVATLHLREAVQ